MKSMAWNYERLPDLLWTTLIIGNTERNKALNYFRYIAKYVEKNPECWDITISGISKLPELKLKDFTNYFVKYSNEINNLLRALLLFPELPGFNVWEKVLDKPIVEEDWQKIVNGVRKTFWHQSQEATDCRWIKVFCRILSGKFKFPFSMDNKVKEIIEYPNYGDMRSVRPTIRAMEMIPNFNENTDRKGWKDYFWKHCYKNTICIPENSSEERLNKVKDDIDKDRNKRKIYYKDLKIIKKGLIDHFFNISEKVNIDSRFEGVFGLSLYGFTLIMEIIYYQLSFSIAGRTLLRALVETYITFAYMLQKEKTMPTIWDEYRIYGAGQAKLIYLKMKDLKEAVSCIDVEKLENIANEDKWIEFVPMNIGHWESTNLRKMSEECGQKDIYDKYYNYTSGYIHANWGGVREAVFEKCLNPLHRFHNIPTLTNLPFIPNVTNDSIIILNKILDCLDIAYPKFIYRLKRAR